MSQGRSRKRKEEVEDAMVVFDRGEGCEGKNFFVASL